jgi:sialidase-1
VIGSDAANRVSNPSAIVDRTTGKILVFSVVTVRQGGGGTGKGLYLQTSSDDGRTFTSLLSRPIRPGGTYKGGLPGPGHAIQLSVTHPGRIVVPLGYKTSGGAYGAYGIYSDDHGATWTTGYDQQDRTGHVQFIEGTLTELPGGDLFISYRNKWDGATVGTARQYAFSQDGGATLSGPFTRLPLSIVSVQGSALALKGTYSNQLLFSAPAVQDVNLRRQMSVFVSTTKGATWGKRYPIELQDTPGSYSDLVQLGDSTIGILYETGVVTWKERIAFRSVPIPALTHPTQVASRVTYERSAKPTSTTSQAAVTVTVSVAGAPSPPGRVTVSYAGPRSGRTAVDLTYSNKGLRKLLLPRLPAGSYKLTLTYSGTVRIKPATVSAGTLTVVG